MEHQIPLGLEVRADLGSADDGLTHPVAPDLAFKTLTFVNVGFVGAPGAGDRQWVLIDAGVPGTAGTIEKAAAERFGAHARPAAIVLTHGHVDHRGALPALAAQWDAPIYAHPLELPYLDGRASYPPNWRGTSSGLPCPRTAATSTNPREPMKTARPTCRPSDSKAADELLGWHVPPPGWPTVARNAHGGSTSRSCRANGFFNKRGCRR